MFLNPKDLYITHDLLYDGAYERLETDLVIREIKKGDVVLDLGANIGYYTLLFAKLVGDEGKVFAFEPDPKSFALLKKNVKINGYKNVILLQKAVSNITDKAKLYLCEDNFGDHRIYDSKDGRKFIKIETVRVDDYFKDFSRGIDFVKMDIQGAEPLAVEGMVGLLNRKGTLKIVSEYWPIGIKRCGKDHEEYLRLLMSYGFTLYHINKLRNAIEPLDIPTILNNLTPEKEDYTDIFCVRER
jgi:FkbM family methyltransferase